MRERWCGRDVRGEGEGPNHRPFPKAEIQKKPKTVTKKLILGTKRKRRG